MFFVLENPQNSLAYSGRIDPIAFEPVLYAWLGRMHLFRPLVISTALGRELKDVIWIPPIPIFHRCVIDTLIANKVTGFEAIPVIVRNLRDEENADYRLMRILGRCKRLSLDKENAREIVYEERKHGRFPYYQGLKLDLESWDGSDIFCGGEGPTAYGGVTERVRTLLVRCKVSNVVMTPFEQVRVKAMDMTDLPPLPNV